MIVMDLGVTLDNGMPWLLWPIPLIRLDWNYPWITVDLTLLHRLVIWPNEPFCVIAKAEISAYDVSFWYRYLKNTQPSHSAGFPLPHQRVSGRVYHLFKLCHGVS